MQPSLRPCFIDGEWVEASSGESLEVINPATEEVVARVPRCGSSEIDNAVASAKRALPSWKETTPAMRAGLLFELAEAMREKAGDLASMESLNVGKPAHAAELEVDHAIDALRFFAGAARCLVGPAVAEYESDMTMMIRREPIGVAGLITPWNYPINMAIWKLGPALAAGNTCVLKPSELTPMTSLMLAEMAESLFPPGVINVVTGLGEEAGEALVDHVDVGVIAITGGTETGRRVAERAGRSLKRVHLELGGKAPAIILDDADGEALAQRLRGGTFWNAGQDCTAATRLLIASSVYDAVVDQVVDMASSLKVGPPTNGRVDMGPLVSKEQEVRVLGFLERASAAKVLVGGDKIGSTGFFVQPTVIGEVEQADEIVQREVFGPVLTVQRFDSIADAIRMANDVSYGLSASVWTRDVSLALDISRLLDFGTVWINDHGTFISEMPHGGFKDSGYGKDLSYLALDDFSRVKNVMAKIDRRVPR